MRCKKIIYALWVLTSFLSASGQCPLRDTLWNRISFLAKNLTPVDIQLEELLSFQSKLARCPESRDSTDAYLLQRIGVMYYKKRDYQTAVEFTIQSLNWLRDLQSKIHSNPFQKFICFWNLNIYYDSLNLAGKKNEALDSCVSIGLGSNINSMYVLYAFQSKINDLLDIGEYSRCIKYATLSQKLAEKYGVLNSETAGEIFTVKIDAMRLLGDYQAVAGELKNEMAKYDRIQLNTNTGNLFELWAAYYLGVGKIDSAIMSYKKAFEIYAKIKFAPGCASSLNGLGFIYSDSLKKYSIALMYYFKALSYFDTRQSLSALTNVGNVYTKKHVYDSAFYYYQKAFDQISPGLDEDRLLDARNIQSFRSLAEYLVTLVLDKADAHLSQYKSTQIASQLKQTLVLYRKADQVMERIKENQFDLQSKLSWRKNARRLYENAIEASRLANNSEDGLYFFEKSRAVLLDDQLKEDKLTLSQEAMSLFQIRSRINQLENELDTANPQSGLYLEAQAEMIKRKGEQDRLQLSIREKDPLYYARNSNVDTITIRDIQNNILKDHQAVMEIFNGDSSVFTLVISKDGGRISKIDKNSFDSLSRLFLFFLSGEVELNNQFPAFANTSKKLYELIFAGHPLPTGRIIISPDGACFPFEALIDSKKDGVHYLIEDRTISYTYSARYLMSQFPINSKNKQIDFMGMAPVGYAAYLNLVPLVGSDISLNKIQSYFSKPFVSISDSATKRNFLSNFSDYRIIQLYSHASYNEALGKPVIYFADSSLNLSELFSREKPSARLVVLSACETALGKEYKGEGVFSFSREFAALGIPASVSNLWSVNNESTYQITEWFYQFIASGLPTDEALRQAKLKFIKESTGEKKLPFYWASPILTGRTEIIRTKSRFPFGDIVVVSAATGLAFWLFTRKRRGDKVRFKGTIV